MSSGYEHIPPPGCKLSIQRTWKFNRRKNMFLHARRSRREHKNEYFSVHHSSRFCTEFNLPQGQDCGVNVRESSCAQDLLLASRNAFATCSCSSYDKPRAPHVRHHDRRRGSTILADHTLTCVHGEISRLGCFGRRIFPEYPLKGQPQSRVEKVMFYPASFSSFAAFLSFLRPRREIANLVFYEPRRCHRRSVSPGTAPMSRTP